VTPAEAQHLIDAIQKLVDRQPRSQDDMLYTKPPKGKADVDTKQVPTVNSIGEARSAFSDGDLEKLYQAFKARLIDECRIDPILLQLLTQRPELVVEVEPRVVTLDGSSLKGRVAQLIAQGWLAEKRTTSGIRHELVRTGPDPGGGGRLSETLNGLLGDGFLVRAGDGWLQAPGIKITERQLQTST
jgi:hypothetical protein